MQGRKRCFSLGVVVGVILAIAIEAVAIYAFTRTDAGYRVLVQRAAKKLKKPTFPMTPASYDWTVTDFTSGETVPAERLRGKVAFITFWHPGCPYCVATLPHIQRLYEKAQDEGIEFWCVAELEPSLDEADFRRDVALLIEEHQLTVPVVVLQGKRPEPMAGRGSPVTFILGKDGLIAFKYDGGALWDDDACLRYMQQLNAQAVPTSE